MTRITSENTAIAIMLLMLCCTTFISNAEEAPENLESEPEPESEIAEDLFKLTLEELMTMPIVTTTRTPAFPSELPFKVTVIRREEILQQLALTSDTSQVLANLISSYSPSLQKLSGRGETLRGRNPLILIDGIPQSNPLRDSSRDNYIIDLEMIERIEVVYGANTIQGLGASGGIINFITRTVQAEQGKNTSILLSAGGSDDISGDTGNYKLGVRHISKLDGLSLLAAFSVEERGLYQDGNGDLIGLEHINGDLMNTRSRDLLLKSAYEWDNQRLQASFNHYDIVSHGEYINVPGDPNAGILTTISPGSVPGKPPGNEVINAALDYSHTDLAGGGLSLKLFQQEFEATFGALETAIFQDPASGNGLIDQSQIQSDKQGIQANYVKPSVADLPLTLTVGADVLHDEIVQVLLMTSRTWTPKMEYQSHAPFLQTEYRVGERIIFSAGVRREDAELQVGDYRTIASSNGTFVSGGTLNFGETLHQLGAVYRVNDRWSLSLNYGEGFGMPDVGRVLRAVDTPDMSVTSLLDIAPLITENRELGLRYASDTLLWRLNYFESETPFGSSLLLIGQEFVLNRVRNEVSGWETKLNWQVSAATQLGLLYTDLNGRFDSDGNGRTDSDLSALDVSPDRLILSWTQLWMQNWSTGLQLNHDFSRNFETLGLPAVKFDGYTLVDLTINRRSTVGDFSLGIANITDEQYIPYVTQVETPRADRYFAGRGRSLLLSYRTRF